jgi:hypothetical protein
MMTKDNRLPSNQGILSIDLASRRYGDFGFALLPASSNQVKFLKPDAFGLQGKPAVPDFVYKINLFATENQISVILLDGPQGWKSPSNKVANMRLAEKVLNTPAKMGLIGSVTPKTILRFAAFSINTFHGLRNEYQWKLLTRNWHRAPMHHLLVEVFPTMAWQTLGMEKLPSKRKTDAALLQAQRVQLERITGLILPEDLTHDELQAAVMIPVGQAITSVDEEKILLSGTDPVITRSNDVLEGWIALPLKTSLQQKA